MLSSGALGGMRVISEMPTDSSWDISEAFASPVHHALRIRRADDARLNAPDLATTRPDDAELPPLPLEYEEEDDIYMSLDDPRVGTVDADGNVLVPVDDDGRVLPGFEHLVRPIRIEMDANGVSVKKPSVVQGSPPVANVSKPVVKADEPPTSPNDSEDVVYDEAGTDQQMSKLPALKDYVDSREKSDGSEFADGGDKAGLSSVGSGAGTKVNLTDSRSASPGSDEKDSVDRLGESTDEAEKKVEEIVDEIFNLAKDEELDEISDSVGQGVVGEKVVEEESSKSALTPGMDEADRQKSVEDRGDTPVEPVIIKEAAEVRGEAAIEPFAPEFSDLPDGGENDSDHGQDPPRVGQGVGETIKALPKDDPRDDSEEAEPEAEKRLDHLRRGDRLGLEADDRKGKPDAAPLATASALLVVLVLSLWTA
ncbi:hypothetical protein Aduo_012124 [Ancylostoma duodenale]